MSAGVAWRVGIAKELIDAFAPMGLPASLSEELSYETLVRNAPLET